MDKLKVMWDEQIRFNDQFYQKKLGKNTVDLTLEEKVYWTKNQLLSIVKESMEVLDEVPSWKEHRIADKEFIHSNLWEEIIDVNKFSIGLAQIWGMNYDQYYQEYMRKSMVVQHRWEQEHGFTNIAENAKVVGIDIDGVLGKYEDWFLQYVFEEHHQAFESISEMKIRISTQRYEEIKAAYRQSGWKANMPVNEWAVELTHKLKRLGYSIVILTARPYEKYSRIYPDTLQFLNNNDIKFDAIIWDKKKHLRIINKFPQMKFMIEDNGANAKAVADEGYNVFLLSEHLYPDHTNIKVISSLSEVMDYLDM